MRIGYDKTVPERVPKFFILNCTTYEMQPFPENEVSGAGSLIFLLPPARCCFRKICKKVERTV